MKLLHVIATPRPQESNTMRVANAFVESIKTKMPTLEVDVLDLFASNLPAVAGNNIDTKYTLMVGQTIDKSHEESWSHIEALIDHFISSDIYLITAPMWNFSIPYVLKYYIDCIIQPGYLFMYNEQGQPVPLIHNKRMICVTSRGGDYSENSPFHAYDFQEQYLRAIFGFVGIYDIHFINAQPMDITPQIRDDAVNRAIKEAKRLVKDTDWDLIQSSSGGAKPTALKPKPLH
jgi:FMN-dependent NADH-azoreductase